MGLRGTGALPPVFGRSGILTCNPFPAVYDLWLVSPSSMVAWLFLAQALVGLSIINMHLPALELPLLKTSRHVVPSHRIQMFPSYITAHWPLPKRWGNPTPFSLSPLLGIHDLPGRVTNPSEYHSNYCLNYKDDNPPRRFFKNFVKKWNSIG